MKIVISCQPVDAEFFRQKDQKKFAAADFSAGGDGTARDPAALFLST
jgi:hypothetical protein